LASVSELPITRRAIWCVCKPAPARRSDQAPVRARVFDRLHSVVSTWAHGPWIISDASPPYCSKGSAQRSAI
jgi:hypothetical protein